MSLVIVISPVVSQLFSLSSVIFIGHLKRTSRETAVCTRAQSPIFLAMICEHLHNFLKDNALLHQLQSGFRKSHSTETALVRLVDQVLFDLDRNKVSGLVFYGLQKRPSTLLTAGCCCGNSKSMEF